MNPLAAPAGRKTLFAALYLSEGAPIGFIWWYLPTKLRAAGVPLEEITALTSLLILPWALKFVWAPLVDTLRSRRWTLRAWIVSTQALMGAALLPLLAIDPRANFALLYALLLTHAFAAATQDAAVDALAISVTPAAERGALNGWMQVGMLLGRSLFGGVALVVDEHFGQSAVVLALVAAVWFSMALVLVSREPEPSRQETPQRSFSAALKAAARKQSTWLGLLFAAVSGAGFEAVGSVAGPYLVDRGLSQAEVGRFLALPAVSAMLIGALVGGASSDALGRRSSAAIFLGLLALETLILAGPGASSTTLSLAVLTVLYFSIGLFVAASYALFMDLTDPQLGATQFSAFMAATNVCESLSALAVGRLVAGYGYPTAFTLMALASLFGLAPLRFMRG